MPDAEKLKHKLELLYYKNKKITNQADLAAHLGITTQTITGWIKGTATTPADYIPAKHIPGVAALLAARLTISDERALALLLGRLENVEAELFRVRPVSLIPILRKHESNLQVVVDVPQEFGVVRGSLKLALPATRLTTSVGVVFTIHAKPACNHVVFCGDRNGWRLLSPGVFQAGRIADDLVIFPMGEYTTIKFDEAGLNHLIFIEHPQDLVPALPQGSILTELAPLDSALLDPFARNLELPPWQGKWRWTELLFDIV